MKGGHLPASRPGTACTILAMQPANFLNSLPSFHTSRAWCAGAALQQGRAAKPRVFLHCNAATACHTIAGSHGLMSSKKSNRDKGGALMQLTEKHKEYWHKNLVITAILLFIWFVVTFVEGWFARELNSVSFFGFPLGFYMSAQGSLIVYCVIIYVYARYMNALDITYGVDEGEDE
jgi:putative solute:sodium symporter small subunit